MPLPDRQHVLEAAKGGFSHRLFRLGTLLFANMMALTAPHSCCVAELAFPVRLSRTHPLLRRRDAHAVPLTPAIPQLLPGGVSMLQ